MQLHASFIVAFLLSHVTVAYFSGYAHLCDKKIAEHEINTIPLRCLPNRNNNFRERYQLTTEAIKWHVHSH